MAVCFFESGLLALAQAAGIAMLSLEGFIEFLGEMGVAAVDYPVAELDEEAARAGV